MHFQMPSKSCLRIKCFQDLIIHSTLEPSSAQGRCFVISFFITEALEGDLYPSYSDSVICYFCDFAQLPDHGYRVSNVDR